MKDETTCLILDIKLIFGFENNCPNSGQSDDTKKAYFSVKDIRASLNLTIDSGNISCTESS